MAVAMLIGRHGCLIARHRWRRWLDYVAGYWCLWRYIDEYLGGFGIGGISCLHEHVINDVGFSLWEKMFVS